MASRIDQILREIADVKNVEFDLSKKQVIVTHRTSLEKILHTLSEAGISARVLSPHPSALAKPSGVNRRVIHFTLLSGILVFSGLLGEQFDLSSNLTIPLYALAILFGGYPIAGKGWKEARQLTLGMNFLMSIAVIGAMAIGQWSEAAMVIFLFFTWPIF